METPQGRDCWPHGDHRQGRFQDQGPRIHAPIAERPGKNPILLPKTIAQICRVKVNLLMDRLIYDAFAEAVITTSNTDIADLPWRLVRNVAISLNNESRAPKAAA